MTDSELTFDSVMKRIKQGLGISKDFEAADALNMKPGTFAQAKKRGSIPFDEIVTMCNISGLSLDWVLSGRGPQRRGDASSALDAIVDQARIDFEAVTDADAGSYEEALRKAYEPYAMIPRYDIEVSAGHGAVVEGDRYSCLLAFRRDWLKREIGVSESSLAVIAVKGDSMDSGEGRNTDIRNGDLLLVNKDIHEVRDDAVYVIRYDGHLIVKRIQKLIDGGIRIASDNQSYSPQNVSAADMDSIKIAGRVVYVFSGRKL